MSLQSEQEKMAFKKMFRNFRTFPKELPEKFQPNVNYPFDNFSR